METTQFNVKESIELLSELIQNKCVNPPGNEMKSIKTIERFLEEHNVKSQIFESAPNRGNLVARIPGTNNGSKLMFGPSHVDVVPVENSDAWQVDPFSGIVKDDYVWGRGALDMLYIVVTQVQAFCKLVEENFRPKGDLILLIVSDEEAGSTYGTEWMLKHHSDLIKTDYLVTEAGGIFLSPNRVVVMIGEKGSSSKRISFNGTSGHGSMPYGSDNATIKVAEAIRRLSSYNPAVTTEYLGYLAQGLRLGKIKRMMLTNKTLLSFSLNNLKNRDPHMAKIIHGLSRMTLSPNVVHGGSKVNVIAEKAFVDVDIRTLPRQDEEYVINHLKKALGPLAKEAIIESLSDKETGLTSYGNASPASSEFIKIMEKAIQQSGLPEATLVPFIMPAVSDCRFFRKIGVDSYGFSLFDPNTPMNHLANLVHGIDERIGIKTLELSQKAYYNLAKIFVGN